MWLAQTTYQIDLSELDGKKFTCLDGCGLCCLCQPELLEGEVAYFRRNHADRLIAKRQPHKHFALAMKKKVGSCSFLNDRRCDIYNIRPHYCRQFPFHIYIGTRVQVELDLSCRGVWTDRGEDCTTIGAHMVQENEKVILPTYEEANQVHRQFFRNCLDMECDCNPSQLRSDVVPFLDRFNDLSYIATLLEGSAEEEKLDINTLKPEELETKRRRELEEAALEAARDSLGSADPFDAPIYSAMDCSWNIFRFEGNGIERYVLTDAGDLEHRSSISPDLVKLMAPLDDGKLVMQRYMRMLNQRDSLMGNAFYLMDDYGYEDHTSNIYYGVLATSALEVLWRSSLLAHVNGGKMDGAGVREGIIYYDMDRLDAPTIGAFL
jgi:Fe-S-cluster containining protein